MDDQQSANLLLSVAYESLSGPAYATSNYESTTSSTSSRATATYVQPEQAAESPTASTSSTSAHGSTTTPASLQTTISFLKTHWTYIMTGCGFKIVECLHPVGSEAYLRENRYCCLPCSISAVKRDVQFMAENHHSVTTCHGYWRSFERSWEGAMRRPTNGGTVPEVLKVSLKLKPEGTTGGMTFWWTTSEMATPLIVEEDYLGFEY